jgi:dihydroxyacetone kinase-like protein
MSSSDQRNGHTAAQLPDLLRAVTIALEENAEVVAELDRAIGDGDHLVNLRRGIDALRAQGDELARMDWPSAWQQIGMILMTTVGGASGSLYGTLFVTMGKAARGKGLTLQTLADSFGEGVEAVKRRGKVEPGEKTLVDVLDPVAKALARLAQVEVPLSRLVEELAQVAETGMESTRDLVATKGRASFLGERSKGWIDPGAKTAQLMIGAVGQALMSGASESTADPGG